MSAIHDTAYYLFHHATKMGREPKSHSLPAQLTFPSEKFESAGTPLQIQDNPDLPRAGIVCDL
jgi:hypothetical protein